MMQLKQIGLLGILALAFAVPAQALSVSPKIPLIEKATSIKPVHEHRRYGNGYHNRPRHYDDRYNDGYGRNNGYGNQGHSGYGGGYGGNRRCGRVGERINNSEYEALLYIASYPDLARKFGADARRGQEHFNRYGCREGRYIRFDAIQYVAGYDDLIRAFGTDERAALHHYFKFGVREGRSIDRFCGKAYADSFGDLKHQYGYNEHALAIHYIEYGTRENRHRNAKFKFQKAC